jgi:hypothetical protein
MRSDPSKNLGKYLHPKKSEHTTKPAKFVRNEGTSTPMNPKLANRPPKKPKL